MTSPEPEQPVIVLAWGCMQPLYRFLCRAFADAFLLASPGLVKAVVDGHFVSEYGAAWEVYRDAFVGNYCLSEEVIEFEGLEVAFYVAGCGWVPVLAYCVVTDTCGLDDVLCTQREPYDG